MNEFALWVISVLASIFLGWSFAIIEADSDWRLDCKALHAHRSGEAVYKCEELK